MANARKLACSIIKDQFGDEVERVAQCLLRRGTGLGLTLNELIKGTALEAPTLRNCLLVLIHHNCVQPYRLQPPLDQVGPGSEPILYLGLLNNILQRLRFPKFIQFAKDSLGEQAADVIEAFAEHGRLSFSQLHQRATARATTPDKAGTLRGELAGSVAALLSERMLEKVGSALPNVTTRGAAADAVIKSGVGSRGRVRSRQLMEASGYFVNEEQRITSIARVPETDRYRIPHFIQHADADADALLPPSVTPTPTPVPVPVPAPSVPLTKLTPKRKRAQAATEEAKASKKGTASGAVVAAATQNGNGNTGAAEVRKQDGTGATDALSEKEEEETLLWRINHEEFLRRFRHQEVAKFIRETADPAAGVVAEAMLQAGKGQEVSLQHPYSTSLSLEAIAHAVRHSTDGRTMAMTSERIRTTLQSLVLHPKGLASRSSDSLGSGHFTLETGKIIELVKLREVEAIISQRFGSAACRIFRMLQQKKCLEQKQIAELAMIPLAEARQLLYRLLLEEFVHLQEVPKTADHAPQRTFYLWRVSVKKASQAVLEHMCKAALNLRLRLAHEMEKEDEVLSLLENIQASAAGEGRNKQGGGGVEDKQLALTAGQRAQLERIRRVAAVLEVSLLRLDQSIMLFADF